MANSPPGDFGGVARAMHLVKITLPLYAGRVEGFSGFAYANEHIGPKKDRGLSPIAANGSRKLGRKTWIGRVKRCFWCASGGPPPAAILFGKDVETKRPDHAAAIFAGKRLLEGSSLCEHTQSLKDVQRGRCCSPT